MLPALLEVGFILQRFVESQPAPLIGHPVALIDGFVERNTQFRT